MANKNHEQELTDCHDCGASPGEIHEVGCDVERCSVCGHQFLSCPHDEGHDRQFARWTGLWPGEAETEILGIDLNEFYEKGLHEYFFVKPDNNREKHELGRGS